MNSRRKFLGSLCALTSAAVLKANNFSDEQLSGTKNGMFW